ncbi:hypothetical protein RJ641_035807 [Dillenia turbinata]|uniref:U-box domain-containing protein n=1 Tax=Dillenia turbinata TaxID=194707 RepID=A0AAN8ZGC6_9MAGN
MASSEDMGLVQAQRLFQDETLRFNCAAAAAAAAAAPPPPQQRRTVGDPGPKTRELSGFIGDKLFSLDREPRFFHNHQSQSQGGELRRCLYGDHHQPRDPNWNSNGRTSPTSGEGSEDDDDDEEDDEEEDDGDGEVDALVAVDEASKNNNGSGSSTDELGNGKASSFGFAYFGDILEQLGSSKELLGKDGNTIQSANNAARPSPTHHTYHQDQGPYHNAVTIAGPEPDGEMYYSHSQYLHAPATEGSNSGHKEVACENGAGFARPRDAHLSTEPGESLRTILSDPMTGTLMDDAMILPCGHSFGSGGMLHVFRLKACCTCSQPFSEDSVQPNLSLRATVQAYRREEDLQLYRPSKRRRERFEQDKGSSGEREPYMMDAPRTRGVQFPFAVTDRVIIKGNKRTPQRFVGREAVVTTQCLNGWYVVKTLDNAESVKLQYRSLAKVLDGPCSKAPSNNKVNPNWL